MKKHLIRLGILLCLSFYIPYSVHAKEVKEQQDAVEKIEKAFNLIQNQYVQPTEAEELVDAAIEGMVKSLKDPYSMYMDEQLAKQFEQSLGSSFEGIGAEIAKDEKHLMIVSPLKGSPAEKAGIQPKDEIIAIDGKSTTEMTHVQAVLKIRGNKGTVVTLTIKRQSSMKPLTIKVIRDKIPMITVTNKSSKLNDKNVGIITISTFSEKTAEEFAEQLQILEKQNIKGLVVDVRGNPGGYLSSVQEIVNQLSPKGMPIVKIQNRDGVVETYYSKFENKKSYPIAVLTDKGSASASEILAAALHDGAGYPLIGERTFGKGTVQQAVPLGDGSQIKLTMFKWLSPKGTWIHKKGISPDIVVSNGTDREGTKEDKQLQAALQEVTK